MKEIGYCYADDVKNYWEIIDNKNFSYDFDPDLKSDNLKNDLCKLYNRDYLLGLTCTENYLTFKNLNFGADSIANLLEIDQLLIDKNLLKDYYVAMNTIGGKIIFPKNGSGCTSINPARNCKLQDRFDFTLECIRRYYLGKCSRLTETFSLEINQSFFNLFGNGQSGFDNYVRFFFLDDLVSNDYKKVLYFINDIDNQSNLSNFEHSITKHPYDNTLWFELYLNTLSFVKKRNIRIQKYLNNLKNDIFKN